MMKRLALSLLLLGFAARGFAQTPNPDELQNLVEQLGHASYQIREDATRELVRIGPPALSLVQKTLDTTADLEVRSRCERLLPILQVKADSARLLAPKMVKLDYKNTPLRDVLTSLGAATNIPITAKPNVDASRRIDLTDGEVPIWRAVERVCEVAELTEELPTTAMLMTPGAYGLPARPLQPQPPGFFPPSQPIPGRVTTESVLPFVLISGKLTPGHQAADLPIRVRAIPQSPMPQPQQPDSGVLNTQNGLLNILTGPNQVALYLDVTAPTTISWRGTRRVTITHCEDEEGRTVSRNEISEKLPQLTIPEEAVLGGRRVWGGGPNGGVVGIANPNISFHRLVPLVLRGTGSTPKALKRLEGVIHGEIQEFAHSFLQLADLPKQVGAKHTMTRQATLTVQSYEKPVEDRITVKLRVDGLRQEVIQQGGITYVQPNTYQQILLEGCRFSDAEGRTYDRPAPTLTRSIVNGNMQSLEMQFQFRLSDKFGPPTKLTISGPKLTPVEVPFALKNVSLK